MSRTVGRIGLVSELLRRGISPNYADNGILVVNQKCIRPNGVLDLQYSRRHDEADREIPEDLLIQPGDILINSTGTGTLGRSCVVREVETRMTWDSHVTLVRPRQQKVHYSYLGWVIESEEQQLIELSVGSTNQIELSRGTVFNLEISLPPLETQQRITDYLDRETTEIDAAVADLDKYVELLEKRRQILVSEAVDSLSSASLIKTVRNLETLGWLELGRGKVISKEDMENSPGDYPVYSSAFTDNGFFGKYGEYLFEDERISWSIDGGGMPFYRHKHRYSLTNVSGWMRVADDSVLDVKYLYYAVLNEWYRNSFDYALKAHPSVIRDLYSISIPALSSQQQTADYLDRETAEIDNLIAESKKLRDLLLKRRSVLIAEVVTGRKQV